MGESRVVKRSESTIKKSDWVSNGFFDIISLVILLAKIPPYLPLIKGGEKLRGFFPDQILVCGG
jgi:hypothetical protein